MTTFQRDSAIQMNPDDANEIVVKNLDTKSLITIPVFSKRTTSANSIKEEEDDVSTLTNSSFEQDESDCNLLKVPVYKPRSSSLEKPTVQETMVKIMVLGTSGVGKSQIFNQLTKSKFNPYSQPTAGIDFSSYSIKIEAEKIIKAQIIDTSGLEAFRSVTQQYWGLAHGAIVVYDITNADSFTDVKRWVRDFRAKHSPNSVKSNPSSPNPFTSRSTTPTPPSPLPNSSSNSPAKKKPDPIIMIIGNKCDLLEEREVRTEDAQAYALVNDFLFMETSASENLNVVMAFNILISQVYYNVVTGGTARTHNRSDVGFDTKNLNHLLQPPPFDRTRDRRRSYDQVLVNQAKNLLGTFSNLMSYLDENSTEDQSDIVDGDSFGVPIKINEKKANPDFSKLELAEVEEEEEEIIKQDRIKAFEANFKSQQPLSHTLARSKTMQVRKSRYI
ncbi:hypothetical protein HDU92_002159 [Lobulomyces angularis]|nr:hypothetical protein HDU92_002159 [Lobulomyces angularis]